MNKQVIINHDKKSSLLFLVYEVLFFSFLMSYHIHQRSTPPPRQQQQRSVERNRKSQYDTNNKIIHHHDSILAFKNIDDKDDLVAINEKVFTNTTGAINSNFHFVKTSNKQLFPWKKVKNKSVIFYIQISELNNDNYLDNNKNTDEEYSSSSSADDDDDKRKKIINILQEFRHEMVFGKV
jgi:hypothetical protein